jgi:hypothetical protein
LKLFFVSFDFLIPVVFDEDEPFNLNIFAELAKSSYQGVNPDTGVFQSTGEMFGNLFRFDKPWGISTGIKGYLGFVFEYRAEYQHLHNGFVAKYFDRFYDYQRSDQEKYGQIINPPSGTILDSYNGMRTIARLNLDFIEELDDMSFFELDFTFYLENTNINFLKFTIFLEEGIIKNTTILIELYKKNIVHLLEDKFLDENTILDIDVTYKFSETFYLLVFFRRSYIRNVSGELIPSDNFGFETRLTF